MKHELSEQDLQLRYEQFKAESARKRDLEEKLEKQLANKNKHTYQVHFMSRSLGSDYGSFRCDRCGVIYYHSPTSIFKDDKEVYEYACGNCTNSIIYKDHNYEPFS